MRKAIQSNATILAIFAIVCTAIVGIVHSLTKDTIATQKQLQLVKQLSEVINPASYNNNIINSCIMITSPALGSTSPQVAYIAKQNDLPVGIALKSTAPDGYSGNIQMLIGIKSDGIVSGVRVLEHKETPGLGDKVETRKSDWINSFTNRNTTDEEDSRWNVKKDGGIFDEFTGATITPRAVVKAVHKALIYFNSNKEALFKQPYAKVNCGGDNE